MIWSIISKPVILAVSPPDGPVGPPYVSKPIIQLAARTGWPLLAFCWDASASYEFNSWDRTTLLPPFSLVIAVSVCDVNPCTSSGLTEQNMKTCGEFDRRMNHLAYQARYYVKNKLKNYSKKQKKKSNC